MATGRDEYPGAPPSGALTGKGSHRLLPWETPIQPHPGSSFGAQFPDAPKSTPSHLASGSHLSEHEGRGTADQEDTAYTPKEAYGFATETWGKPWRAGFRAFLSGWGGVWTPRRPPGGVDLPDVGFRQEGHSNRACCQAVRRVCTQQWPAAEGEVRTSLRGRKTNRGRTPFAHHAPHTPSPREGLECLPLAMRETHIHEGAQHGC